MGTKPQSSGLLSKVAKIFRTPGGGASAKDGAESQHSVVDEAEKNALQDLIQRKRQDDLVRRREFNYLRKLRRSPHGASRPGTDGSERTSAFSPSSGFSVDDRASTLKKIDAIEAHMISTWARSKVAAVAPASPKGGTPAASGAPVFDYVPTEPAPLRTEVPRKPNGGPTVEDPATSEAFDNMDLDFTGLLSAPGEAAVDTWDAAPASRGAMATPEPTLPVLADFAVPELPLMSAQVKTVVPVMAEPPEPLPESIETALQEAAIQFAEGDAASAEAVLLGLMQVEGISTSTADVLASALFDLYRATGEQDGFDVVAMDYAERFGRSPGEWFSLPQWLKKHAASAGAAPDSVVPPTEHGKVWDAPKHLTSVAVAALRSQFAGTDVAWHVDWLALTKIDAESAVALSELMTYWCTTPVSLHWSGIDSLLQALEQHTPADDNTVDPIWWRLRMDALCILQRHDDFESLALDYCVVFEVSPPSWRPADCHFVRDQTPSGFSAMADNPPSIFGDDLPVLAGPYAAFELVGEILGESNEALTRMVAVGGSADHVVVSCALTVRLDFPAAGAVLNWVIDRQAKGCQVQFIQVPRLVAVFFHMLGIDQYAKIVVRAN